MKFRERRVTDFDALKLWKGLLGTEPSLGLKRISLDVVSLHSSFKKDFVGH